MKVMGIRSAAALIVIMAKPDRAWHRGDEVIPLDGRRKGHWRRSADGHVEVGFTLRSDEEGNVDGLGPLRLLLGDDSEWAEAGEHACMAHAAFVVVDFESKTIRLNSSIVGLPPVFLYEDDHVLIATSDLYLLAGVPAIRLQFNGQSVREMCTIGHPIDHRTLFQNTRMVPGGCQLAIGADAVPRESSLWRLEAPAPLKQWEEFTELQIAIFRDALRKTNLTASFLSLTAGLDTRAVVAELGHAGRALPAYTISGRTLSLDAMTARRICRAYGWPHHVVDLRQRFLEKLPSYAAEASRLSGGLSGLGQAHEIHLYENVGTATIRRLSGNLGNQIGRRGTEKIAMLNADDTILGEGLGEGRARFGRNHWYHAGAPTADSRPDFTFLLQQEVPFSSVGNYSLGSHFAVQQSPYASRLLIESTRRRPLVERRPARLSLMQMRLQDLRHRFVGEAEEHSFQVQLIKQRGGPAATIPINWGWRAAGGVSPRGLAYGAMALCDALMCSRGLDSGALYKALEAVNIAGLHEYRSLHQELGLLKAYVHDVLCSEPVRNGGLLNRGRIIQMLREHYEEGRSHDKALSRALDLAMAQLNFRARVG